MEYYSALKTEEILLHTTGVKLDIIMLSEIRSHRRAYILYDSRYMRCLQKSDSETESRMWLSGAGGERPWGVSV